MCNRPFVNIQQMELSYFHMFNSKVSEDDHVYHLGDFMLGNYKYTRFVEMVKSFGGKWHFVLGNHDSHSIAKWKEQLLADKDNNIVEIDNYIRLRHNNIFFIMFHYEIKYWDKRNWRTLKHRNFDAAYHLFGHSHSDTNRVYERDSVDVGIDATGGKLLTIEEHVKRIEANNSFLKQSENG